MVEIFDNIRKIYRFAAPCEELADYIEFFSESSEEATARLSAGRNFEVKMFPSWTPTFWINLGTGYGLRLGRQEFMVRPREDIVLIRDDVAIRHNLPSDYIFSVKFFPGGLEAIFGINQTRFTGRPADLRQILPGRLLQEVKRPIPFEQRKCLLENYFLQRFHRQTKKDHYRQLVSESMEIYSGNMQHNISQVAGRVFLSSRTINRYFNTVVGTSPKKYFSVVRARAALTAYVADRQAFDPAVFGYHDGSHFYREMIKFTGQKLTVQV